MNRSIAALPVLVVCLSSCSASTLFRANFDLDPVGGLPATSPPGEPFGDEIWLATLVAGGSIPHPVTVVGGGAISGRSLRYGNLDIPSLVREVRFISRELDGSRDRYWAYWVGRLDDVAPTTSPLDIHFGNFTVGLAPAPSEALTSTSFRPDDVLTMTSKRSSSRSVSSVTLIAVPPAASAAIDIASSAVIGGAIPSRTANSVEGGTNRIVSDLPGAELFWHAPSERLVAKRTAMVGPAFIRNLLLQLLAGLSPRVPILGTGECDGCDESRGTISREVGGERLMYVKR